MMKKTNLDEMQEQKLLKIEHIGFWLGFWGLAVIIYIQIAMGNNSFAYIGGEVVILSIMSLYVVADCIRNGIWDRKRNPTLKNNLIASLIAGLAAGGFWFVVSYSNYHMLANSFLTFTIVFLSVSVLALAALMITSAIYQHKKHQLDRQSDQEENEE
ncbi:MAG: hypothetical protein Q4A63_07630 [Butyricicoccus pullicaecorum]|nr:hypothetical protein [Butyricicoccus pullicaecorum]